MKTKNKVLGVFTSVAVVTFAVHLSNKILYVLSNTSSSLRTNDRKTYEWKYGNISYKVSGTGSPVLLIHDLTCGSSDVEWKYIVNELSKTHTVYSIDLLGCGRSDKPVLTYTNFLYVQLITDFVRNVIGKRTDIITSGISSDIAIMACKNDQSIFNKVILVNPGINSYISKKNKVAKNIIKNIFSLPVYGTLLFNLFNSFTKYTFLFNEKFFYNSKNVKHSYIKAYYDAAHNGRQSGRCLLSSILSGYTGCNVKNAIKDIDNSILIIKGSYEEGIYEITSYYKELNPSIETATIKYTKHLPHMESPEEFLRILSIFIG